jgi:hypothetical protein
VNSFRHQNYRSAGRRRGAWLPRLLAGGCAALVLVLGVLAANPAAHHWLHHDSDDPDHDCGVVIFASGLTPAANSVVVKAYWLILTPTPPSVYRRPDLVAPRYALQPERGPPEA